MADDPELIPETEYPPLLAAPIAGTIAPAPYSFEFTGEDRLRVIVHNSLAGVRVGIHYRVHREGAATHASAHTIAPSADRLASVSEVTIGRGYLLNVVAFAAAGTPQIGHTFVTVQVIRGSGVAATVLGVILQDYVTARQAIAWPGSPIRLSTEGSGVIRHVVGGQPATGAMPWEFVPTGARWELLSIMCALTTSATAGTREPELGYHLGNTTYALSNTPIAQGPSATWTYSWSHGVAAARFQVRQIASGSMPTAPILVPGASFFLFVSGLAAGDAWSQPIYTVREWLEANL